MLAKHIDLSTGAAIATLINVKIEVLHIQFATPFFF